MNLTNPTNGNGQEVRHAELIKRVAQMKVYEVPHDQIAKACGLSDINLVEMILQNPACQQEIADITTKEFEQSKTINEAWDMTEATGLNIMIQALRNNPDPDFALRAAMYANKAQRRGIHNNRPINGDTVERVIVTLNANFVNKLQQNWNVMRREAATLTQKDQDFLPPTDVESIFGGKPQQLEDASVPADSGYNFGEAFAEALVAS